MAALNALISYASLRRLSPVASISPSPSPPSPSFGSSRILDHEPKFASIRVGRSLRWHPGREVEDPDMLERIRLTESSERLAPGEVFGIKAPQKKVDLDVATHISIKDDGPKRSMLYTETADRPGLLMLIIKILSDINLSVESAEIDTEGLVAKDKFHVSYRVSIAGVDQLPPLLPSVSWNR